MKYTDTPWVVSSGTTICSMGERFVLVGNTLDIGGISGTTLEEMRANAEHIVHCVNLHGELVAMLADVSKRIENAEVWWMDSPDRGGFDKDAIDSLLSRARGEKAGE